jgi:outer membrane receptor protein involved in Fe transport
VDAAGALPAAVLSGTRELGLWGLQIPDEYGGLGLSNSAYARVVEEFVLDPSTAVTLMAHQSIGLKGLLLNEHLSYTLAAFNVEQDNQVTDNPANPGGLDLTLPRSIPGAATRSRGVNLDVGGKLTDNLTLLANISWTDVRIVRHATLPDLIGTHPLGGQNVPPLTYAFAARYNFREGLLRGLRAGLTYQYADKHLRIASSATATAITVPFFSEAVSEWSAVVGYAVKKFRNGMRLDLSLNVTNLLDRKQMTLAAFYPEGRTMLFTTGLRF